VYVTCIGPFIYSRIFYRRSSKVNSIYRGTFVCNMHWAIRLRQKFHGDDYDSYKISVLLLTSVSKVEKDLSCMWCTYCIFENDTISTLIGAIRPEDLHKIVG